MSTALRIAPESIRDLRPIPELPSAHRALLDAIDDPRWADLAVCKGETELFFGLPRERPERRAKREAIARKYCAVCPSQMPCRNTARANGENGFWGGESEEERAAAGFPPRSILRRGVLAAARSAS